MSELRTLHDEMLEMLDALEAMTARPGPDEPALASLRYRLRRTSTARRKLVESLCDQYQARLSGAAAEPLRALRQALAATLAHSSEHISGWGMREIVRDWPGYCHASFEIRRIMREQVDREKIVLYPLIEAQGLGTP